MLLYILIFKSLRGLSFELSRVYGRRIKSQEVIVEIEQRQPQGSCPILWILVEKVWFNVKGLMITQQSTEVEIQPSTIDQLIRIIDHSAKRVGTTWKVLWKSCESRTDTPAQVRICAPVDKFRTASVLYGCLEDRGGMRVSIYVGLENGHLVAQTIQLTSGYPVRIAKLFVI